MIMRTIKKLMVSLLLISSMGLITAMQCDEETQKKLNTELMSAVFNDCPDKVVQAVRRGADVNHRASQFGDTPLMVAIFLGKSNVIATLLESKANVLARNNNGETALHYALPGRSDLALIRVLLEKQADIYTKNIFGISPIDRLDEHTRHAVFTLYHHIKDPREAHLPSLPGVLPNIPFNPFTD